MHACTFVFVVAIAATVPPTTAVNHLRSLSRLLIADTYAPVRRYAEYPKMQELLSMKDRMVQDCNTPPFYIKASGGKGLCARVRVRVPVRARLTLAAPCVWLRLRARVHACERTSTRRCARLLRSQRPHAHERARARRRTCVA